ncbi:MAG: hypothetical protein AAGC60_14555 [Acidobacteriota bacterium]
MHRNHLVHRAATACLFCLALLVTLGCPGATPPPETTPAEDDSDCPVLGTCGELLEAILPSGEPACGCQSMEIVATSGASTGVYCIPPERVSELPSGCSFAQLGASNPCDDDQVPFRCPLGRRAPDFQGRQLSFGFETRVKLLAGSTPDVCGQGQYVRSDGFSNRVLNEPPPIAEPAPDAGLKGLRKAAGTDPFRFRALKEPREVPRRNAMDGNLAQFGADGYTEQNDPSKRYETDAIRWRDAPGVSGVFPFQSSAYQGDFVTFVTAGDNTCWCRFEVEVQYVPRNPNATGTGLKLVDGFRCVGIDL